jgi:hypothetical protein
MSLIDAPSVIRCFDANDVLTLHDFAHRSSISCKPNMRVGRRAAAVGCDPGRGEEDHRECGGPHTRPDENRFALTLTTSHPLRFYHTHTNTHTHLLLL